MYLEIMNNTFIIVISGEVSGIREGYTGSFRCCLNILFLCILFFGNKYSKLLRSAGAGWLGNLTYSYSIYSLYSSACFNII